MSNRTLAFVSSRSGSKPRADSSAKNAAVASMVAIPLLMLRLAVAALYGGPGDGRVTNGSGGLESRQLRQDLPLVEAEEAILVWPDLADVDVVVARVDARLDRLEML